ncbi:MAG: hypothetical protein HY791_13300 [Deltaproteobacteria bacterium]|nr:hypothetical protein [Deltaproteobacteria bacterium]
MAEIGALRSSFSTAFSKALLVALALVSEAQAAIPGIESLTSSTLDRRVRGNLSTLVLTGVRKRSETDDHPVRVKEWIRIGQGHRLELEDDTGKQIVLITRGLRYEWRDGKGAPKPTRAKADVLSTFLTNPMGVPEAVRFLAEQKIDVEEINLGRISGQVAYVVGAKPWESEKNQLWIDKQLKAPLALKKSEKADGDSKGRSINEVRWLEWGSGQTEEWFPRRIEVLKSGTLVELTIYESVEPNVELDDRLFDPPGP